MTEKCTECCGTGTHGVEHMVNCSVCDGHGLVETFTRKSRPKITVSKKLKMPRQDLMKTSLMVPSGALLTWNEMFPSRTQTDEEKADSDEFFADQFGIPT